MAGTRSSARQNNSSPQSAKSNGGTKRKADDSSPPTSQKAKRGAKSKTAKEQKTIEETLPAATDLPPDEDVMIKDAEEVAEEDANGKGELKSPYLTPTMLMWSRWRGGG